MEDCPLLTHKYTELDEKTPAPLKSAKLFVPVKNANFSFEEAREILKNNRKYLPFGAGLTNMNGFPTILIRSKKELKYEDIDTSKLIGISFAIQHFTSKIIAA